MGGGVEAGIEEAGSKRDAKFFWYYMTTTSTCTSTSTSTSLSYTATLTVTLTGCTPPYPSTPAAKQPSLSLWTSTQYTTKPPANNLFYCYCYVFFCFLKIPRRMRYLVVFVIINIIVIK